MDSRLAHAIFKADSQCSPTQLESTLSRFRKWIRCTRRGKVQVFEGHAPGGQDHETIMAGVVAQEFGIHPNDVTVMYGDTRATPLGSGTIGARSRGLGPEPLPTQFYALRPFRIEIDELPLRPDRCRERLKEAKRQAPAE